MNRNCNSAKGSRRCNSRKITFIRFQTEVACRRKIGGTGSYCVVYGMSYYAIFKIRFCNKSNIINNYLASCSLQFPDTQGKIARSCKTGSKSKRSIQELYHARSLTSLFLHQYFVHKGILPIPEQVLSGYRDSLDPAGHHWQCQFRHNYRVGYYNCLTIHPLLRLVLRGHTLFLQNWIELNCRPGFQLFPYYLMGNITASHS